MKIVLLILISSFFSSFNNNYSRALIDSLISDLCPPVPKLENTIQVGTSRQIDAVIELHCQPGYQFDDFTIVKNTTCINMVWTTLPKPCQGKNSIPTKK